MTDVTISGCTDPAKRLQKLTERRQHLDDMIKQIQDQRYIIEGEIVDCQREILKHMGFFPCSETLVVSRTCPR